jgi:hypothetical protein
LARARVLLARRLARYGLGVSGGALGLALAQEAAAWLPPPLVACTVKAAAGLAAGQAVAGVVSTKVAVLTEGVMKAMLLSRLKTATALVLVVVVLGLGVAAYQTPAAEPKEASKAATPTSVPRTVSPSRTDKDKAPDADRRLPADMMMFTQAFVSLDKKGKVAVRAMVTTVQAVQSITPDGRNVTEYRQTSYLRTKHYDRNEIRVYDTDGNKVSAKALAGLLKKEVLVLVNANPVKPDPLHLRMFKKGTLIVALPAKDTPPVPMAIVPPAPGPGGGGGPVPPAAPQPAVLPPPKRIAPPAPAVPPAATPPAKAPPGGDYSPP